MKRGHMYAGFVFSPVQLTIVTWEVNYSQPRREFQKQTINFNLHTDLWSLTESYTPVFHPSQSMNVLLSSGSMFSMKLSL